MKTWFKFNAKTKDPAVAEVEIIDFIGDWVDDFFGFGVTAKAFVSELEKISPEVKTIRVHINSPGGDVFGALNIANALREQKAKGRTIETIVDGLAASAATLVMMAGDVIRVADNALIMIHNPWSSAAGDADEFRKSAEVLDHVRDTIITTYQWHVTLTSDELIQLMSAETWMDADQAIEWGFANEKIEGLSVAAAFDPARLARYAVPELHATKLKALFAQREEVVATAEEVFGICRDIGIDDIAFAYSVIDKKLSAAKAEQALAAEKSRRADVAARDAGIRALCAKFKGETFADALVESGIPLASAQLVVLKLAAVIDRSEIDTSIAPNQSAAKPRLNPSAVYEARRR